MIYLKSFIFNTDNSNLNELEKKKHQNQRDKTEL